MPQRRASRRGTLQVRTAPLRPARRGRTGRAPSSVARGAGTMVAGLPRERPARQKAHRTLLSVGRGELPSAEKGAQRTASKPPPHTPPHRARWRTASPQQMMPESNDRAGVRASEGAEGGTTRRANPSHLPAIAQRAHHGRLLAAATRRKRPEIKRSSAQAAGACAHTPNRSPEACTPPPRAARRRADPRTAAPRRGHAQRRAAPSRAALAA
jgi:hypothetical protein